jgi:hypothetical protein
VKILVDGKEIAKSSAGENLIEFNAQAGKSYIILNI